MYLTYDTQFEGAGAQYQRILCLLSIAKRHNLKYIHKKITVDHNYDNDSEWDNKWDDFFNISKLSYHGNVEASSVIKYQGIDNNILNSIINSNNLNSICFSFSIVDANPDYYYKSIQDDVIYAYDKVNSNRKLMYSEDKISIALHIRAYNQCDGLDFSDRRYAISCDEYYKLITKFKTLYNNAEIHIFSQKTFDEKYSLLRDIPDLNIHLDYDTFDTFHHLCKADILVMGTSSFSYLAGIYNKKSVVYYSFWHPPLDNWINFKNFI
jgi:hypothetical protein